MLSAKHEDDMAYYIVWNPNSKTDEAYWVEASSADAARRVIASSVEEAKDANDPTKFECQVNTGKTPPPGMIYRRLHGPVAVLSRTSDA
jgi:hypothetical protein